jgi:hypothetical protein
MRKHANRTKVGTVSLLGHGPTTTIGRDARTTLSRALTSFLHIRPLLWAGT